MAKTILQRDTEADPQQEFVTIAKDFYAQDTDPGAVGAGSVWRDTTSGPYLIYTRNAANDGWDADFAIHVQAVVDEAADVRRTAAASGSGAANVTSQASSVDGLATVASQATATGGGNATATREATSDAGPAVADSTATGNGGSASVSSIATSTSGQATANNIATSPNGAETILSSGDGAAYAEVRATVNGGIAEVQINAAKQGFFGAATVTRPELPATPTPQDNADALVTLGLVTQVEPVLAAGGLTVVRIPVTFADFVGPDGNGAALALTDYIIPEGAILLSAGIVITTPFDDSSTVGGVIDFVYGTEADTSHSIADTNADAPGEGSLGNLWSLTNFSYLGVDGFSAPYIAKVDTPVSFVLPIFADDGTTGAAEGILFIIPPVP